MNLRSFYAILISLMTIVMMTGCTKTNVNGTRIPVESSSTWVMPSLGPELQSKTVVVQLPPGWARNNHPDIGIPTGHIQGVVAFNSWGDCNFVAAASHFNSSTTYSGDIILEQVINGGAYVILEYTNMPVFSRPPDTVNNDLTDLLEPIGMPEEGHPVYQSFGFVKWGRSYSLSVYCSVGVSSNTIQQLNDLLESWRFVN